MSTNHRSPVRSSHVGDSPTRSGVSISVRIAGSIMRGWLTNSPPSSVWRRSVRSSGSSLTAHAFEHSGTRFQDVVLHRVMGGLLPSLEYGLNDCGMLVLHVTNMLRRAFEAKAARYGLSDCKVGLEPGANRDVKLVVAGSGDGVVQGKVLLRAEITPLEAEFQRCERLLDSRPVCGLPVSCRQFCGRGFEARPEFEEALYVGERTDRYLLQNGGIGLLANIGARTF